MAFTAVVGLWMMIGVMMTGCGTTPAQRIAVVERTLDRYRDAAAAIDKSIPELEALIAAAEGQLVGAGDSGGELADKVRGFLADARPKLAAARAEKAEVDAAVTEWQARLAEISADPNVTWADELEAAGTGLQATAPLFGPKAWIISSIGGLLVLGATLFGATQRNRARDLNSMAEMNSSALTEVVRGVSAWISRSSDAKEIKTLLKGHQTPLTRSMVDRLRPSA